MSVQSRSVRALTAGNHCINHAIIVLLSGTMTAFFLCTSVSYFPGGAGSFLLYAQAIASGQHSLDIVQRDIGFPLLLVLTGFTLTGSLVGVIAAQALMALVTPLLVSIAIGKAYPRVAFFTGLLCILSLVPYQFIKMIHHDQLYLFLTLASAVTLLWFLRSGKPIALYAMMSVALATSLTRPAGAVLFPVLLICAWAGRRGKPAHYLLAGALFAALTYANYEYRRAMMGLARDAPMPSYSGQQAYQNVYLNSREFGIQFSPDLGPGLRRLALEIRKEFPEPASHPRILEYKELAPEFFEAALNIADPDRFVERIFSNPSYEYHQIVHTLPSTAFDSGLFAQASWDVVAAHPLYPVRYTLRNLASYFLLPGYYHPRLADTWLMWRSGPQYMPQVGGIADEPGLTEGAKRELAYAPLQAGFAGLSKPAAFLQNQFEKKYNTVNRVVMALSVIALCAGILVGAARISSSANLRRWAAGIGGGELAAMIFGVFAIVLYNALITCAFVDPIHRYQYMTMPVQIICAGFGLCVIANVASALRSATGPTTGANTEHLSSGNA